jgi:PAS domain S-box-containing protein
VPETTRFLNQDYPIRREGKAMRNKPDTAQDQLRYQANLIENVSDAIVSTDQNFVIKSWNKAAEKIYGWTAAEAIGQPVDTLLRTEFISTSRETVVHELMTSGDVRLDVIHRDRNGNNHIVRCSISLLKDERGNRTGVAGILRDITELKRVEESLAEREQLYRALFDLSPAGILLSDAAGRIMEVNDALCKNFGYTREELLGKNVRVLVPADRHPEVEQFGAEILSGKTLQHEVINIGKKGTLHRMELRETSIPLPGDEMGILTVSTDITERKRAEEKLWEKEIRFRTLFENANDAIFMMDGYGFIECNSRTEEMFGCTREQILGQPPFEFSPPLQPDGRNSKEKAMEKMNRAMQGEPQQFEWRHARYDGTPFEAEVSLNRVEMSGKMYLQALVRDISIRKKSDERINMLAHALRSIHECVSITDMEDKIVFINDAFLKTYGYEASELEGENIALLRSPNTDAAISSRILPRTSEGGWHGVLLNRRKNGEDFPVELSTSIIRDEQGNALAFVGVAQDITERRRVEERVNMLAHALRSISDCVSVTDLQDRFIFVNEAFCRTYGYAESELFGKHVSLVVSSKNDPEVLSEVLRETRQGSWHGVLMDKRKNGEEFPVALSTSAIRDEQGNSIALVGVAQDITERKLAEEQLRQSNLELQTALAEVKTLSGMLPICANCKKIRDDKGYWNQLEAYIVHHTDAQFTHGLCPDCVKALYPYKK